MEYRLNANHIAKIADAAFNRTQVNDVIEKYDSAYDKLRMGGLDVIYATFGDPSQYGGIGTYRGYKRHEQRCMYFMESAKSNGYNPGGNRALISRIRDGWKMGPDGNVPVPDEVGVYITSGVAGALRLLCDALIFPPVPDVSVPEIINLEKTLLDRRDKGQPPSEDEYNQVLKILDEVRRCCVKSNVVMPLWTYSSHLAEVFRAHGQVRTCDITDEGQINTKSLGEKICSKTKAVIFATVGNPLSTAMHPEVFDEVLKVVREKMDEFKRPIIVIADTIYEHFRRRPETRIDPVRRAAQLDLGVPVVDTSSFSKMMVLAGARAGFIRHFWDRDSFSAERHDFLRALELLYWPTLCPVANQPQLALGELYGSINRREPIEEDLAPLAAMLTALKNIAENKGRNIKSTFFSYLEVMQRMQEWGVEPEHYLDSTVATQTRKLANKQLQGYAVDIDHEKMGMLIEKAVRAGIISVAEINGENCLKLEKPELVPPLKRDEQGQLKLFGISMNADWIKIAEMCGIKTEDVAYDEHKSYMRETCFERTDYFVDQIMTVPGVRLHPAYFKQNGEIDRDRFNAFYAMWAFEGLMEFNPKMVQAARIAELCIQNSKSVIATIPGELFLPPEIRHLHPSFVREVTLTTKEQTDEVVKSAKVISREAA
jgi:aspartate/methionine/tyrosine aminotransferase